MSSYKVCAAYGPGTCLIMSYHSSKMNSPRIKSILQEITTIVMTVKFQLCKITYFIMYSGHKHVTDVKLDSTGQDTVTGIKL